MKSISIVFALIILLLQGVLKAQEDKLGDSLSMALPPQLRFVRVYGAGDETKPPVILCSRPTLERFPLTNLIERSLTIQLDIQYKIPPQVYVIFKHCNADWSDDDNAFLNDPALLRTSSVEWRMAPPASIWYNWRGLLTVPNEQVKFNYGGNWKAEFYLFDNPRQPLATARFFVIDPRAETRLDIFGDFYNPRTTAYTSGAYTVEATTRMLQNMPDGQIHTAAFYRLNRYSEPFFVSSNSDYEEQNYRLHRYEMNTMISGFGNTGRRFRIEKIPAENEYRVLDLTDFTRYPRTAAPIPLWRPDLWRNAGFTEQSDGGVMITRFLSSGDEDYQQIEFMMNPEGRISKADVFISGSFNNWHPDASWMMRWDDQARLYRLRQWVPRGRHGYLYLSGTVNADTGFGSRLTAEEFEGNTSRGGHRFVVLIYLREFGMGGYDTIIGVAGGSVYGSW
jgi:hypothetical protein